MRHIAPDPLGEQRTCYLYPSSASKDVCAAAPAACTGSHTDAALTLTHAAIEGTVPTQLGLLHATLEHLDLSHNALSGTLPTTLGRLTRLRTLALEGQRVSGSVPTECGGWTRLQHLTLHSNALSGALPSELGRVNPPHCYLVAAAQRSGLDEPSAGAAGVENRFACPLPALSAGCGMNGVAFARRDAHHAGQCHAMPGIAAHAFGLEAS